MNLTNDSKKVLKTFYRHINSRKQMISGIEPLINEAGATVTDDKEMATTLNNYYNREQ